MFSINSVSISGNLTKDSEYVLRKTRDGEDFGVLKFKICQNKGRDKIPMFFDVQVLGKSATTFNKYKDLQKGVFVTISGSLDYTSWTNNEGEKRGMVLITAVAIVGANLPQGDSKSISVSSSSIENTDDIPF